MSRALNLKLRHAGLKPWKIEDVLDGWRLRVQLTAAAQDLRSDANALRKRALELLKGALFRGRLIAKERLEAGAGGIDCSELLASVQDEVIKALFDFAVNQVFRTHNRTMAERLCICATGGYGRFSLAPSSDIDVLFIRPAKDAPWAESLIEYILYMMWDMGLKVGNASRTVPECLRAAKEDYTIRTSVLETRYICGDSELFEELRFRLRNELFQNTASDFIAEKLKERDTRHKKQGESRYMVEPNIKDGKGGLRDLHTIFWIIKYVHDIDLDDTKSLVEKNIFTREQAKSIEAAAEFLWTVRCHLHFLTGCAEERITFDLQPEMARLMGYGDRADNPAVERFMKHYFLVSKSVGIVTRILSAKLEAEHLKKAPKGFSNLFGISKPKTISEKKFTVTSGRLGFTNLSIAQKDHSSMLELFLSAHELNLDIEPNSLAEIARLSAKNIKLYDNSEARALFLKIMEVRGGPFEILTLMNETGLLGRMVPEFGRIVGQTQFNMYHHFTVDEHTLRALKILGEIEKGEFERQLPISTSIFPKIKNRRALFLAMLLHDVGKGEGDQQILGAKAARKACERLEIGEEEISIIEWLVGHHLIMSDTAQKRDLGDPLTIANFAKITDSLEKLRLLLALTAADIMAVGPGIWNDWKAQLLRDLYKLTEATLRGGRTDEDYVRQVLAQGAQDSREQIVKDESVKKWFATIDDAYWLGFDEGQHKWHYEEISRMLSKSSFPHVAIRFSPTRGATEVLVICKDREGLFASLASVFANNGANVLDARIFTSRNGEALDVFALQGTDARAFGFDEPHLIEMLKQNLFQAIEKDQKISVNSKNKLPKRLAAFQVAPIVVFDNIASNYDTVIEISGYDRPGLLAQIAAVFNEEALNITSAHIGGTGERAQDAFYFRTIDGLKLIEPHRQTRVKEKLEAILMDNMPQAPTLVSKRQLAQARASLRR